MKRIVFVVLLAITAATLSSCHKTGVSLFVGDYSFKTSGEVSLIAQANINDNNIIIPAVVNVRLSNDIGQLNISGSDKGNDKVIVIINYLSGEVFSTTGTCNGNTIELDEFQRNILPVSVTTWSGMSTSIKISGTGHIYDDDCIVFNMTYNGKGTLDKITYIIKDNNIKMVAYRN